MTRYWQAEFWIGAWAGYWCGCVVGLAIGLVVGAIGFSSAQMDQQPWNPYAPGSFNSSTNLYNSQIDQDTDNYLNSLKLNHQKAPCPY